VGWAQLVLGKAVVSPALGSGSRGSGARGGGVARASRRAGRAGATESALARARLSDVALPRTRVGEIQRSRLLASAVATIDELGYPRATVGRITTRARLSRRTFYQMFANRDECFAAVLEELAVTVAGELAVAGLEGLAWRERVRMGVWGILALFDREPALARVCVVQALRAGPQVLQRRENGLGGRRFRQLRRTGRRQTVPPGVQRLCASEVVNRIQGCGHAGSAQ